MTKKKTKQDVLVSSKSAPESVPSAASIPSLEYKAPIKPEDPILSARIIQVRVYQAVTFNGVSETTFMMEGNQLKKPVSARIIPELFSVLIENDLDQVLVPMTNVSGIYYENARYRKKQAVLKAEADKKFAIRATLTDKTVKPK